MAWEFIFLSTQASAWHHKQLGSCRRNICCVQRALINTGLPSRGGTLLNGFSLLIPQVSPASFTNRSKFRLLTMLHSQPCCEREMKCTPPWALPAGLSAQQLLLQDLFRWYTRQSVALLSGTSWGMRQVGSHRNLTLACKLNIFYRTPAWNVAFLWPNSSDFGLVLLKQCFQSTLSDLGARLPYELCCEWYVEFLQKAFEIPRRYWETVVAKTPPWRFHMLQH